MQGGRHTHPVAREPGADIRATIERQAAEGVREFSIRDASLSCDRVALCALLDALWSRAPDAFVSVLVDVRQIDRACVAALGNGPCSVEIPLCGTERDGRLLFDKRQYASKARLLNEAGLVFGFDMGWGMQRGDTFKLFRSRLDFALSLFPNHIVFDQFSSIDMSPICSPRPTGVYSSKDMDFSCGMAFACRTFYTCGRAVPWFSTVLAPLKITPSSFFSDFDEWQQCNNCSFVTGFVPEEHPHAELETMQLLFLRQKYEEKHKESLYAAVADLVCIHGAFSRLVADGQESVLRLSYSPDDLLSPAVLDLASFCDSVCQEPGQVRIFWGADGPDYRSVG